MGISIGYAYGNRKWVTPEQAAWTKRMNFELRDLREAAEKYRFHDKRTHGVWPTLVWERRNQSPTARLDDLVSFLGKSNALRFKGGGAKFRKIYATWLGTNLDALERLRGKVLYELKPRDFDDVLRLSSGLRDNGAPPTTLGKALHFLLPDTVMLWDQEIVRNTYKLRSDPQSFVSYQRFGSKLLHHIVSGQSDVALIELEKDHAKSVGYFEPMTTILDHLAYSPKLAAKAVSSLGGPKQAFSDNP